MTLQSKRRIITAILLSRRSVDVAIDNDVASLPFRIIIVVLLSWTPQTKQL